MNSLQRFLADTRGVDTIPLKMVFYLSIAGMIILMTAFSWNNIFPVIDDAHVDKQLEDVGLVISSIQNGYARDISSNDVAGIMGVLDLSLPEHVEYVSFGVDPDPDMDGNLTNTAWALEKNTILCSYSEGFKTRVHIDGDAIEFRKGISNDGGVWVIDDDGSASGHDKGVVLEGPISGEFVFELVFVEGEGKYTLTHF
ncbi:hypothetical protein [Methanococcoides alaskense]|uniref:Uncharacterized protein n=1 Tax=Methanococcoides alaskense TaxID=325778 RepID=A0AA90TXL3_9EURY|nr:hypothetical protein [Methanococcoides alaskense]MDA0525261.1 hypothetical protein [Methanococcoides alaskense]MDR6221815.1 hypothetical protein [Methanococcoides alaskense]